MSKLKPLKPLRPLKPLKPLKPRIRARYAHCEMFSSAPMRCPLCGADVPPFTPHQCSKKETD